MKLKCIKLHAVHGHMWPTWMKYPWRRSKRCSGICSPDRVSRLASRGSTPRSSSTSKPFCSTANKNSRWQKKSQITTVCCKEDLKNNNKKCTHFDSSTFLTSYFHRFAYSAKDVTVRPEHRKVQCGSRTILSRCRKASWDKSVSAAVSPRNNGSLKRCASDRNFLTVCYRNTNK